MNFKKVQLFITYLSGSGCLKEDKIVPHSPAGCLMNHGISEDHSSKSTEVDCSEEVAGRPPLAIPGFGGNVNVKTGA